MGQTPTDSDPDWAPRGAFSLRRSERLISVRLPFFSEAFRKAAHSLRGSWSATHRAWQFPLAKEASVLRSLDRLAQAHPEALGGEPEAEGEPGRPPEPRPASLLNPRQGGALGLSVDEEAGLMLARFDYHGALVEAARSCAGSRWSASRSLWEIPLTASNAQRVNAIHQRSAAARTAFEAANAPFRDLELQDPISFPAEPGPFALSLSFDPEAMAYRLASWLDLGHPLGRWAIMEPLADLGLGAAPKGELLLFPKLGRQGSKTAILPASSREALLEALGAARERLASLGEPRLIERPRLGKFFSPLSEPGVPQDLAGGDVLLSGQGAWLLAPSKRADAPKPSEGPRSRAPLMAWSFELSGSQARQWIRRWGKGGLARCAWASEIDLPTLNRYLEALEISDTLGRAPLAKTTAAPRL